ncbi:MAG TPA: hypothetical protein VFZ64_16030 [Nocardioidaceae bacterium]
MSSQLLVGCGETGAQDLCTQYEELVVAADELRAKDPASTEVEELRAAADDVRAELDQFQAVSEGRLDDAISRLRANVDAARQAAVDAGDEARETVQPLIQDALERVEESWLILQGIAETQCPDEG